MIHLFAVRPGTFNSFWVIKIKKINWVPDVFLFLYIYFSLVYKEFREELVKSDEYLPWTTQIFFERFVINYYAVFAGQIGTGHRGIEETVLTEQFQTIKLTQQ